MITNDHSHCLAFTLEEGRIKRDKFSAFISSLKKVDNDSNCFNEIQKDPFLIKDKAIFRENKYEFDIEIGIYFADERISSLNMDVSNAKIFASQYCFAFFDYTLLKVLQDMITCNVFKLSIEVLQGKTILQVSAKNPTVIVNIDQNQYWKIVSFYFQRLNQIFFENYNIYQTPLIFDIKKHLQSEEMSFKSISIYPQQIVQIFSKYLNLENGFLFSKKPEDLIKATTNVKLKGGWLITDNLSQVFNYFIETSMYKTYLLDILNNNSLFFNQSKYQTRIPSRATLILCNKNDIDKCCDCIKEEYRNKINEKQNLKKRVELFLLIIKSAKDFSNHTFLEYQNADFVICDDSLLLNFHDINALSEMKFSDFWISSLLLGESKNKKQSFAYLSRQIPPSIYRFWWNRILILFHCGIESSIENQNGSKTKIECTRFLTSTYRWIIARPEFLKRTVFIREIIANFLLQQKESINQIPTSLMSMLSSTNIQDSSQSKKGEEICFHNYFIDIHPLEVLSLNNKVQDSILKENRTQDLKFEKLTNIKEYIQKLLRKENNNLDSFRKLKLNEFLSKKQDITCEICCDKISKYMCLLPCFHSFCFTCLDLTNKNECPLCRGKLNLIEKSLSPFCYFYEHGTSHPYDHLVKVKSKLEPVKKLKRKKTSKTEKEEIKDEEKEQETILLTTKLNFLIQRLFETFKKKPSNIAIIVENEELGQHLQETLKKFFENISTIRNIFQFLKNPNEIPNSENSILIIQNNVDMGMTEFPFIDILIFYHPCLKTEVYEREFYLRKYVNMCRIIQFSNSKEKTKKLTIIHLVNSHFQEKSIVDSLFSNKNLEFEIKNFYPNLSENDCF